MKRRIELLVERTFSKFGLQIQRTPYSWKDDETFRSLLKQIEGYTLVDPPRCFILYQLLKQVNGMNGDVAEIGVYKGGTARLISKVLAKTDKIVHLFDTFSGMPQADITKDLHKEGDFSHTSLESVKKYLKDCDNVRFYPGVFPDTSSPIKNLQFCFVHIDVDIYKSVLDSCKFFYPRMIKGGIMISDDYGFPTCPGAKMAVDEFFSDKLESPCCLPTRQCFIIKL